MRRPNVKNGLAASGAFVTTGGANGNAYEDKLRPLGSLGEIVRPVANRRGRADDSPSLYDDVLAARVPSSGMGSGNVSRPLAVGGWSRCPRC